MNKIEFFFDCSSPWTYLAFHGFQEIIKNNDNIEITKMLIDEGADFNMRNNKNLTPLDRVIGWNDDFSANLLRKHGGKTDEELKAEGAK